jgi:DNA-binding response OmpR family regulator
LIFRFQRLGTDTIKAQREAAAVPIVVLTGLNDEEIAMRAVEEGAQDYLFKDRRMAIC